MPSVEHLIPFLLATAVFAYVPGPATLYATAQTLAGGYRNGLMAALGLHVGGYAHVIAATFGLAVLLELVPPLYLALKLLGAAYLVWLGVQMIRTRHLDRPASAPPAPKRTFGQSVTVEVLNPKTALFYVAFLPQFSDPMALWPIWAQLLTLGVVVNVMFSSADLICVALAHRLSRALSSGGRAATRLRVLSGGTLVGLGLITALDR